MQKSAFLKFIAIMILFVISTKGFTQTENEEEHDHYHHHNNEVSMAVGVVPLDHENQVAAGLHFHYVRGVAFENKLGVGAGFETIFDEHRHYTLSVVMQYRVWKGWTVAYAPGILFFKEEDDFENQFAQHIETAYEFDLGIFHLGPMAEIGIEKHGTHYMVGLHFGIDF
jgi:hypothetical protein